MRMLWEKTPKHYNLALGVEQIIYMEEAQFILMPPPRNPLKICIFPDTTDINQHRCEREYLAFVFWLSGKLSDQRSIQLLFYPVN